MSAHRYSLAWSSGPGGHHGRSLPVVIRGRYMAPQMGHELWTAHQKVLPAYSAYCVDTQATAGRTGITCVYISVIGILIYGVF